MALHSAEEVTKVCSPSYQLEPQEGIDANLTSDRIRSEVGVQHQGLRCDPNTHIGAFTGRCPWW